MSLQEILRQLGEDFGVRVDLTVLILTGALMMARIVPVLFLSPFLGGDVVQQDVKIGMGLVLTAVLFPAVAGQMSNIPLSPLPFLVLLLKELFVGLTLAYIGIWFEVAQVGGALVDLFSGSNMAQVHVPQLGERVTLFASLKFQLMVVIFLTMNGHHLIIEAFADSLTAIPLDRFPAFSGGMWPLFDAVIKMFAEIFPTALVLAAPGFLATFLTDLALGMVNRVAPQVQVFFIAMQIKPMVAVLVMLFALHVVSGVLGQLSAEMIAAFRNAIVLLS